MVKEKLTDWDPAEHMETEEHMAAYLTAALEENDPALVAVALGDIVRAYGMTQMAKTTGLSRASLYKTLSAEGNPELGTILKIVHALGISLNATRLSEIPAASPHKTVRKKRSKPIPPSTPTRVSA
jgi:probable addiction module antidote protein